MLHLIMFHPRIYYVCFSVVMLIASGQTARAKDGVLRAGILGCDTSHVIAFTNLINDPKATGALADVEVTVAYPGGSPDLPTSVDRVAGFVKQLHKKGIKIVDSLEEFAKECDAVMLESVDGRPHLKQFCAVAQGKPIFVDKPAAASLADVIAIYRVAEETHTPVYSSSSLRFCKEVQEAAHSKKLGELLSCDTSGPMITQGFHPDLYWYGIHGVEPLYAILGTGCETVSRTETDLCTLVVGKWKNGRMGSYRGLHKGYNFALTAYGSKGVVQHSGISGYEGAAEEICKFFKSGKPPGSRDEVVEIYAFMEAADESKRQGGKAVLLSEIIERAEQQAAASIAAARGK
ncbi:MAG: gfo/Idh/MocA family oxidoreductase [Pirellulales bacterium]|nr:gfo/Idh/MocA family oxidoreductase [Pirellulales bacterium]